MSVLFYLQVIKDVLRMGEYYEKLKEFAMKIISSITVFGLILSIIGMKPISAAEIQEFDGDYFLCKR